MLVCQIGIVMLAGLNLLVNNALGLMILLHRPSDVRAISKAWHDHRQKKPDVKTEEKGKQPDEETVV
ncbi:MAG: hypothetical protein HY912_14675 [Desulfomonile tiedjei]|uniref:Uncharacterized protein n=1 Tax=Desulfomonile tiedjei TaxID=2358 RepID=A0A9D6V824_9BACT|nr:hypothetical protein [Desulfomonile tiedjei]